MKELKISARSVNREQEPLFNRSNQPCHNRSKEDADMTDRLERDCAKLLRRNEGVTSIEYALIAMLVALVIVAGATVIGASLDGVFANVAAGF